MLGCKELLVIAHLVSTHFGAPANNENYGVGLQCDLGPVEVAVGTYHNSFERQTYYAVVGKDFVSLGPVRFGLIGGLASGYEGKNDAAPLLGGGRISVDVGRVQIGVVGIPPVEKNYGVAHLTIGWRF